MSMSDDVPDSAPAGSCPACGQQLPAGRYGAGPAVPGQARGTAGSGSAAARTAVLDAPAAGIREPGPRRWTTSEIVIGLATLILLISLFLPWFTVGVSTVGSATVTYQASGVQLHGYLWFAFTAALVILFVLVLQPGADKLPLRLPSDRQLILGSAALSFLLVLLAFLTNQGFDRAYGAFVALVAALVALAASAQTLLPSSREAVR
jgi:hypothetical protein